MLTEPKQNDIKIIDEKYKDAVINIALDTFKTERQLIVFVNTKRSAESQAEKIAAKLKPTDKLEELAQKVLKALSTPTKQCKRLAKCVQKGVAFHHSGLHAKQREIIETAFKEKIIKGLCATTTLAAGLNMPAFRVIVRDLKRYGGSWGMVPIPVLEYMQMTGRAGRPGKDPWGEAICIAKDDYEKIQIQAQYINGEPEQITSKLAVEPILRTFVLSLVASGFVKTRAQLIEFFSNTFYAHCYQDMQKLTRILDIIIEKLQNWEFLKGSGSTYDDFTSAADLVAKKDENLYATPIGKRVSELYLDPYTAYHIIKGVNRSTQKTYNAFSLIHLLASCLEIRPYIRVKVSEADIIAEKLAIEETDLLHLQPTRYSDEFDQYLDTIKTAMLFEDWVLEKTEEDILQKFGVRPGELHAKLNIIDWLCYSASELTRLLSFHKQRGQFLKLRIRLKNGAKEELLPLLKLRNVGRVRARKLFRNNIKTVSDLQRIDITTLTQLLGKKIAEKIKEQVGKKIEVHKESEIYEYELDSE